MFKSMRECSGIPEGSMSGCERGERKEEVVEQKGKNEVEHIMGALWGPAGVELQCCKCVGGGWLDCRMVWSFPTDLSLRFCLGLRI